MICVTSSQTWEALRTYKDDDIVLTSDDNSDHLSNHTHILSIHTHLDIRSQSLHKAWNTIHGSKSIKEIKFVLEQLTDDNNLLLVELHAAYANCNMDFGQAKANYPVLS